MRDTETIKEVEEAMVKEAREQLIRAAWEGALKDFTYEPAFMAVLKREYLRIEALFGQKGGCDIATDSRYWDCECDNASYIHKKSDSIYCEKCNTHENDQPDSRANEVDAKEGLAQ